jgi:hypothetical protein
MQAHASRLLVSTEVPHLILAVETSLQYLLGHAPHELVGKNFRILQGPETDTDLLSFSLDNVNAMQGQISLYGRQGLPLIMDVLCEPLFSTSQNKWCILMSLEASETITLGQALGEAACPYALLSAEWPYRIEMVNQRYMEEFGVAVHDVVNKIANHIKPAVVTDSDWQALLYTAAIQGRSAVQRQVHFPTTTSSSVFDVNFVPVVNTPNHRVEHILVRFSTCTQPAHAPFADLPSLATPQYAAAAPDAARLIPWLAPAEPSLEGMSQEIHAGPAAHACRLGRRAATPLIIDEGYVRRLHRRHQAAARRAAPKSHAAGAPPARRRRTLPDSPARPPPAGANGRGPPASPLSTSGASRETSSAPPSPPSTCPPTPELATHGGGGGGGGEIAEDGDVGGWGWLDGGALPLPAWLDSV